METAFTFAFGEPVRLVQQQDRTPKRVFVLGVYASAVHARWVDAQGTTRISALAVASEPYIFWRGDGVTDILSRIKISAALGELRVPASKLNGPSGIAVDEHFLHPLGLARADAWLCDLVPHSCLNPRQKAALEREYQPLVDQYALPEVTLPPVPTLLADDRRRREITAELEESRADTLILLGDQPVRWFLKAFDARWRNLADFGVDRTAYGRLHQTRIGNKAYRVLPLVHPRQAAQLGTHSQDWHALHVNWLEHFASTVLI